MIISTTELHIRNIWKLPLFFRLSSASARQAREAPGNLHVSLKGSLLTGMTMTAWQDEESMMAYRNSGAHGNAMRQLKKVTKRYRTLWYESEALPTWKDARQKLVDKPFREL